MPPHTLASRITAWLIDRRWWLVVVAMVLAALSLRPANKLAFDRSIENMFAPDDPLLTPYYQLKRTFGGNEIVMATYVDAELMTPAGIKRLRDLGTTIRDIPGVADVLTLETLMGEAILNDDDPQALRFRELFEGYTHRIDPESGTVAVAAVAMLVPEAQATVPRQKTIDKLRKAVEKLPQGAIAGEPVMVVDGFRYIEEDGWRLGWISTGLLILTIAVCFRSLRWVLIPLVVVQLTLLLTRALLVVGGLRLSMVSSMLTAIVTVVGVATVVHVIVRFRDARSDGLAPRDALAQTGAILCVPIFWACSTDAVGFASLLCAAVGPVQDFGVMMATGSLLVIVSVALVVAGLALLGRWDPDPRVAWGEARLEGALRRVLHWVERRPKSIGSLVIALAIVAVLGSSRLRVETDFTKNFRANSPVVRSYDFVETHLGGAGVWDVIVPAPEHLDWDVLARVLALEEELRRDVPGLTKVLSIADAVRAGAPTDPSRMRFGRRLMVNAGLGMMRRRMPTFAAALHGEDPNEPGKFYLRIMLRARERQPAGEKQALIEAVTRISRRHFPATDSDPAAEITGFFVLLTNLIESMIRDQWITFGVASLGIGAMMVLAFRSLPLALVALVPNALPILMVTGLLGWLDLKINMGAAMIAAVSLGLSIDSSIHYISSFRRALSEGLSAERALDRVQQNVGRALVFATIALIVGFSALCQSEFVPTIYFGALVSLSMLGGLAGNLIVLPLLLRLLARH